MGSREGGILSLGPRIIGNGALAGAVRGVAGRKGKARRRDKAQRNVLTALAKIEDEAPLHVGAAHQILCHLYGVDSLGAHLALFGA